MFSYLTSNKAACKLHDFLLLCCIQHCLKSIHLAIYSQIIPTTARYTAITVYFVFAGYDIPQLRDNLLIFTG